MYSEWSAKPLFIGSIPIAAQLCLLSTEKPQITRLVRCIKGGEICAKKCAVPALPRIESSGVSQSIAAVEMVHVENGSKTTECYPVIAGVPAGLLLLTEGL